MAKKRDVPERVSRRSPSPRRLSANHLRQRQSSGGLVCSPRYVPRLKKGLGREWGVALRDHTGSYERAGAPEPDLPERTASSKNQRFARVPHHGSRCGPCFEVRE